LTGEQILATYLLETPFPVEDAAETMGAAVEIVLDTQLVVRASTGLARSAVDVTGAQVSTS
jgi:hypothetical protein